MKTTVLYCAELDELSIWYEDDEGHVEWVFDYPLDDTLLRKAFVLIGDF